MKTFVIGSAFVLAIGSFSSVAYAKQADSSDCRIPIAEPSGGATRTRIAIIDKCNQVQLSEQQAPSISPIEQPSSPSEESLPSQQNQKPSSSVQPSASESLPLNTTDSPTNGVTAP